MREPNARKLTTSKKTTAEESHETPSGVFYVYLTTEEWL